MEILWAKENGESRKVNNQQQRSSKQVNDSFEILKGNGFVERERWEEADDR